MKKYRIKALVAGCMLCLVPLSLPADERITDANAALNLRESRAVLIFYHQGRDQVPRDLYPNIDYTVYAVDAVCYNAGIEVVLPYIRNETDSFPVEELQRVCADAGVRWAITVYTAYNNDRLFWRFSIYDAVDAFIRASETFWIPFYAGLSTDSTIDGSVEKLIQSYQQSFFSADFTGDRAVTIPQKFIATEDNIEVFFGDENRVSAGVVKDKELTAPLFLFVQGAPVFGTAVKQGYWEQPFELSAGVTEEPVFLPRPLKKMRQAVSFMIDIRNIPTTPVMYGVGFEYRVYPVLDRWFVKAGYSLWQEEQPLNPDRGRLYQELRFGTGLYLLPDRKFPFRLLAGTGVSVVFVNGTADFLGDPLWIGAEYHFSRFAIISEVRLPELFTYSRHAFGRDDMLGYCISFGVLLKW
ncbi:MAG: hypothetical protein LBB61_07205 [Treponema sp.]|jgi:hypothetical protein|nr:hypothetical protein [Treponema sp.]